MQTHEWKNMLSDVEEKYWDYPIQTQLALAEVVRLRQAMESLRDSLTQPWQDQTDYERGLQAGYGYAAYALNRILEGEE